MKLRLAICWLLLVEVGVCACPVISTSQLMRSSRHLIVRVEKQGKPVAGANISVFGDSGAQPQLTAQTDSSGTAKLLKLKDGIYSISVGFEAATAAESLNVKRRAFAKPTQLTLALVPLVSKAELVAAQNIPFKRKSASFSVSVEDITGAAIPNALIRVFKKGDMDGWSGSLLHTDQNGQATTPLPDGEYLAFILSPGFQSEVVAFEINSKADPTVFPVILQIGIIC